MAERNSYLNIYTSSIKRKEALYFYASTVLKEEAIIATDKERVSAIRCILGGNKVVFLEERNSVENI
ncbi:MAG: hypothetical protein IPM85_15050 [Chitinophagaceae bacterium]|nr:hypothetical protein [Chitinophagaceae bacterium]